ncbi:MAG: hypothetical protein ACK5NN_10160 [Sphingomonadaceae bacterium]
MRFLSVVLYILAFLVACIAFVAYVYIQALGCAFSLAASHNRSCTTKWPWELSGQDLVLLVVLPLALFTVLIVLARLIGRAAQAKI